MGAVTFSIDPALINLLVTLAESEIFVETGTHHGNTVATVLPYFEQVISIEVAEIAHQAAALRFRYDKNVTLIHGRSDQVLGDLMSELQDRRIIFWLDAHWCAGIDHGEIGEACPLLQELRAIGKLNAHSLVLIDDARFFTAPPPFPQQFAQWPRLHEILAVLQNLSSEHRLLILNDVMIFYPPRIEEALYEFAHRHGIDWLTTSQKSEAYNGLVQENLAKEAVIQDIRRDQRTSPYYWLRRIWYRTVLHSKTLSQHHPRPLSIPPHYYRSLEQSPNSPSISIVTPSFNQGDFLPRTLQSVLRQGYPKLEYIIQDGGSTDHTPKVLERYRSQVAHVTSAPDRGMADALNKGFAKSSGEIMAWLNSDDILLPGALAYVARYFQDHPDVDAVYGHRLLIDSYDFEIGRWVLPKHDNKILAWADYVPQETLFWRRSLWEKTGGYIDESYRFSMDWELLLRFQTAGAKFVRLPRFLGAFRIHEQHRTALQLETVGKQEMARLRMAYHGRPIHPLEVQYRIFSYLIRSAWLDRLAAWGILRY